MTSRFENSKIRKFEFDFTNILYGSGCRTLKQYSVVSWPVLRTFRSGPMHASCHHHSQASVSLISRCCSKVRCSKDASEVIGSYRSGLCPADSWEYGSVHYEALDDAYSNILVHHHHFSCCRKTGESSPRFDEGNCQR